MTTHKQELKIWEEQRSEAKNHLMPDEFTTWLKKNPKPMMSKAEYQIILDKCLEEAESKNNARGNIFCPIARDICVKECECYSLAVVHGTIYEKDEETGRIVIPWVTGGYCTAYMLKAGTFLESG